MKVQIDPEGCDLVARKLRDLADAAETERHHVSTTANAVHVSPSTLSKVGTIVAQLRDIASDVERRAGLARAIDAASPGLHGAQVTLSVDSDDPSTIATTLGEQIARDLLREPLTTEDVKRLGTLLTEHAEDQQVVAALMETLGPDGVAKIARLDPEVSAVGLVPTLVGTAGKMSALQVLHTAFGTALATAIAGPETERATALAGAWLRALPQGDIGATGARALLSRTSDEQREDLLTRAPTAAVLLMTPHDVDERFADLAALADEPLSLDRVAEVEAAWAQLSPADRAYLAAVEPWLVGNLDGVPLATRAVANRTAVRSATVTLGERIEELRAQGAAPDVIARAEKRLAMYGRLLDEEIIVRVGDLKVTRVGHDVVLFDPDDSFDGDIDRSRFAEVVGDLATAKYVGVLVPGTGTNLDTMPGNRNRALDFVNAGKGEIAMLSWLGGPLPQEVFFEAFDGAQASALGPHLATFVAGVDVPRGAETTVIGHSYGGSVVGAAEAAGLHADRIVHVESAGTGPGVRSVDDYAHPDTDRYSMTAPGDLIEQSQHFGGPVHGGDPDLLSGVTRLETGRIDAGDPTSPLLYGPSAHSGVFEKESTAFDNLVQVIKGGTVSLAADTRESIGRPYLSPGYTLPADHPAYRPRTQEVP